MGKASKWMINLLLGKKGEKHREKSVTSYEENAADTPPATPTSKRRWSFGKSLSKERSIHKSSKSLDLIPTTPLVTYTSSSLSSSLDLENKQTNKKAAVALASSEVVNKPVVKVKSTNAADRICKPVEYVAATRIQAAFRSYLARKALCALRALVKLQALVRGHLVRKQTTATLRQMHALMAIQVRARFQRIQMVEESKMVTKTQSSRLRGSHREAIAENIYETREVSKNEHGYLHELPKTDRTERVTITKYHSGELTMSKRQREYDEFTFSTAQNSPRSHSATSLTEAYFACEHPDYVHPNYMSNTESSKAKFRSQSEPKQRPKWSMRPKNKRTASMDLGVGQKNVQKQEIGYEERGSWFDNLYRSTNPKDRDHNLKSTTSSTSYSNHNKFLVTFEPHLTLY